MIIIKDAIKVRTKGSNEEYRLQTDVIFKFDKLVETNENKQRIDKNQTKDFGFYSGFQLDSTLFFKNVELESTDDVYVFDDVCGEAVLGCELKHGADYLKVILKDKYEQIHNAFTERHMWTILIK
ncbi:hypothetical protein [Pedobacter sp. L105]|uniref:hypothetical protein n=1 Tax=Pedobacter sp. L105 TaxID=1641871 RepID=UPI00131C8D3E|nr:hypothetical protein [Pedobacter sp. L105]